MSTPKNEQPAKDVLKDLENEPAQKTNSKLQNTFNFFAMLGEFAVNAKDAAIWVAKSAYKIYQMPPVKAAIYSPFSKAQTPTEKLVSVGVLAAGIGAGYMTYGLGWTIYGSKLLASAAVCKGTQMGIGFAKHLFNGASTGEDIDLTSAGKPVKKSQADAEMGDETAPKTPKSTGKKFDLDKF